MAAYTDKSSGLTYTVTQSDLVGLYYNVVITDADGNKVASASNVYVGSIVTGKNDSFNLISAIIGTYVSVPGSTGNINTGVNLLSGLTYYIGGDTTVSLGVSALSGATLNVYGGDLTFSSGIVAGALQGSTINIGYGGTYSSGTNLIGLLSGTKINFTTGGGTLVLNAGGTLLDLSSTTITGYDPSKDTIELQNTTEAISGYVISGSGTSRTVSLRDTSGNEVASYSVTIADGANVPTGVYNNAVNSNDLDKNPLKITYSDGNTYIGACFLSGSMIRTTNGEIAVENIQIGDEVIAFDWRTNTEVVRPVVWVGKTHFNIRHGLSDDEAGWPVRVLKDAIADGVPYKDMLITSEHCLFFKDRFVPVRMLVNGVSIFYDKSISSYDYYHVETEQHSVITADGMLTESYLDTGNRSSFRQEGKIATLRGAVKSWGDDAGAPLGVERSFVEPLFRAIEWREDKISKEQLPAAPELTSDPDLHLVTETGAVVRPMRNAMHEYSFMLPPSTRSVRIVSRASRPSDVIGPFVDDRRYMGVAVGEVCLFCAKQQFDIISHLKTEKPEGWHADMGWQGVAWTNGNAELPLGDHLAHGKMGILSMTVRAAGPYVVNNQKAAKTVKSA
ncbi:outer membrane protein (plasmid) [Acetobacter senegalensis]|uniref:Outer membrane protein n=2 Tax=Acetobacter senegalensis TaxID=446692 RepID=A0A0U5EYN2_9PROT|nr:Hint domain-containing protein [Acetobacter senegalensis]CEF43100.1 outer membrane protein [Acetobacter senegalensis]